MNNTQLKKERGFEQWRNSEALRFKHSLTLESADGMVLVHYIQPLIHPWADEYSTDRSTSQRLIGTAQRSDVSGQNLSPSSPASWSFDSHNHHHSVCYGNTSLLALLALALLVIAP